MVTPDVIRVIPHDDYSVEVLFEDGKKVCFDASKIKEKGVFQTIKNIETFKKCCTVMNHTLAWDLSEESNPNTCLDIDPEVLYSLSDLNVKYEVPAI